MHAGAGLFKCKLQERLWTSDKTYIMKIFQHEQHNIENGKPKQPGLLGYRGDHGFWCTSSGARTTMQGTAVRHARNLLLPT